MTTEYLLLTGVGEDRPGIVHSLTEALTDVGCSIEESRMSILGGEFAIIVLVSATAASIDKLERRVDELQNATGLHFICRRTKEKTSNNKILRYSIDVKSMDHPGIVHAVTDFLANQHINIESLSSETYSAAHSGTPMFSLNMVIEVPASVSVSQLRQSFLEFCDDLLLDASLELV